MKGSIFLQGNLLRSICPSTKKKNKRWRSYSIASWPNGSNVFELIIVYLEGGAGTSYLFNEVKEGTQLTLRGPQGVFILPENIDKDLFLICTGTGVAPFRSMLHYIHQNNLAHKNIFLVFGTRVSKECLYYHELKELEGSLDNYFYFPTFSREPEENTLVRRGYVHHVYEEIAVEKKSPALFYLCGWKNMIDEARQRILSLGYDKKDIHLELYG